MIEFTTKVGRVQVLPIQTKYAAAIYQKIAEGREEIGRFLPWAKGLTLRDEKDFLYQEKNRTYRKHPLVFTMTVNSQPVGMIDLHELDEQKKQPSLATGSPSITNDRELPVKQQRVSFITHTKRWV